MKEKKQAAAPRMFPVEMPERRFQAAILPRVHIESDRAFLLSLYRREGEVRRRQQALAPQDAMRLAGLARSIGRNRGVVRRGRLSVLLAIVALVTAFSLLFKNRLLENALEKGTPGGLQRPGRGGPPRRAAHRRPDRDRSRRGRRPGRADDEPLRVGGY